jgi:hypothetical protein
MKGGTEFRAAYFSGGKNFRQRFSRSFGSLDKTKYIWRVGCCDIRKRGGTDIAKWAP